MLIWITSAPLSLADNYKHICGENDQVYTDLYDDRFDVSLLWVKVTEPPVSHLDGCTGSLIAESLVITASHCNMKPGEYIRFTVESFPKYYMIDSIIEDDIFYDYSIIRIDGKPDIPYREITDKIPEPGEEIYIIGHPGRRDKTITAGDLVRSGNSVAYLADTEGGSSGSGVLDSYGRLFAIHQWGSCLPGMSGYNGGTSIYAIKNVSAVISSILEEDN